MRVPAYTARRQEKDSLTPGLTGRDFPSLTCGNGSEPWRSRQLGQTLLCAFGFISQFDPCVGMLKQYASLFFRHILDHKPALVRKVSVSCYRCFPHLFTFPLPHSNWKRATGTHSFPPPALLIRGECGRNQIAAMKLGLVCAIAWERNRSTRVATLLSSVNRAAV
jgi:hypothetical protein